MCIGPSLLIIGSIVFNCWPIASRPLLVVFAPGTRQQLLLNTSVLTLANRYTFIPDFPTTPTTNHLSIVTGVGPDIHRLLGDYQWKKTKQTLHHFNSTSAFRQNVAYLPNPMEYSSPLWTLSNGTIVMYWWPACPSHHNVKCIPYEHESDGADLVHRIDDIIEQLQSNDMVLVDYELLAVEMRRYGTDTSPVHARWLPLVTFINRVQTAVDDVAIVLISSVSLVNVPIDNVYFIDDFVNMNQIRQLVGYGALMWILPNSGEDYKVHHDLDIAHPIPHCRVHWTRELPIRWRVPADDMAPLLLMCQPGHAVYSRNARQQLPALPQQLTEDFFPKSDYGYDNAADAMQGLVLTNRAAGLTKMQTQIDTFLHFLDVETMHSRDVYQLIGEILQNGSTTCSCPLSLMMLIFIMISAQNL